MLLVFHTRVANGMSNGSLLFTRFTVHSTSQACPNIKQVPLRNEQKVKFGKAFAAAAHAHNIVIKSENVYSVSTSITILIFKKLTLKFVPRVI